MGYHIITIKEDGILQKNYVEDLNLLYYLDDINENSIIYQGEESWEAYRIGENDLYKIYIDPRRGMGVKAEKAFEVFIENNNEIWEKLSQDKKDLKKYCNNRPGIYIKRPDYRLLNFNRKMDIDIEVKSRSFKKDKNNRLTFDLNFHELMKLTNMQNEVTNTPIILAVFQIMENKLNVDVIFFISLQDITRFKNSFDYDKNWKNLKIPIECCQIGIDGLKALIQ